MSQHFYSSTMPRTALAAALTSGAATMLVPSAQWINLPPLYPFTLRIDPGLATEELVDVTGAASAAGANVSVPISRAIDGSTAQAHASGAVVEHSSVARDFNEPSYGVVADAWLYGSVLTPANGAETTVLTTTSFPVVSGRRYRVTVFVAQVRSDNAADLANNRLRLDSITGTILQGIWANVPTSFVALPFPFSVEFLGGAATNNNPGAGNPMTVVAGNHTLRVTTTKNSGTGNSATMNTVGGAGTPNYITVEDLGVG